jgi:hypothetical protein
MLRQRHWRAAFYSRSRPNCARAPFLWMVAVANEDKLSAVLSEFARTVITDFPIEGILDHLVEKIVEILPITSAGVTLISAGMSPRPTSQRCGSSSCRANSTRDHVWLRSSRAKPWKSRIWRMMTGSHCSRRRRWLKGWLRRSPFRSVMALAVLGLSICTE